MPTDILSPIDRLLAYGEIQVSNTGDWPSYLELGLGPEHVPALIRLATDDDKRGQEELEENDPALWAPIHAWRALGQLQAESAGPSLLNLLRFIDEEDDDWVAEEMPQVLAMIGPPVLPALAAYLADPAHGTYARVAASEALSKIGQAHPEARDACVTPIAAALEAGEQNDQALNGFLVSGLLELKAVEATPTIERAFAAGWVDELVVGDWEDVQVELGLKAARETPRPPNPFDLLFQTEEFDEIELEPERPVPEGIRRWNEAAKAKKEAAERAKAERQTKKKRKRGRRKGKGNP